MEHKVIRQTLRSAENNGINTIKHNLGFEARFVTVAPANTQDDWFHSVPFRPKKGLENSHVEILVSEDIVNAKISIIASA